MAVLSGIGLSSVDGCELVVGAQLGAQVVDERGQVGRREAAVPKT